METELHKGLFRGEYLKYIKPVIYVKFLFV